MTRFVNLLLFGFFLASGVCAQSAKAESALEQVKAQYLRRAKAVWTGDVRGFLSVHEPGFSAVDLKGRRMPYRECMDWWIPRIKAKHSAMDLKDLRLQSEGMSEIKVIVVLSIKLTDPTRGFDMRSEDFWRKSQGVWRLTDSRALQAVRPVPAK